MENRVGKYFKYAIGEILLVVIGILIALQVNNWNETRKSQNFEKKLLIELQRTISDDFHNISISIRGNERAQRSSQIILEHIDQDLPYDDSLALHFETTNIWYKMILRETAYEKAKLYGLDFIRNDTTRIKLTQLYEYLQPFANTLDDRQSLYFFNTVTPILLELFESVDKSWNIAKTGNIPYDFEQLKKDKRYRSILKTNIAERKNFNAWIHKTLSAMEDLILRLQEEIDDN